MTPRTARIKRRIARSESLPIVPQTPGDIELIDRTQDDSITEMSDLETQPKTIFQKVINFIERHLLVLENSSNQARDHMANERTYLSWIRTAYILITMGIAFMQMYSIQTRAREVIYDNTTYNLSSSTLIDSLTNLGKPLGYLTAIFLLLTMAFGLVRYMSIQQALQHKKFPATRFLAFLVLVFSVILLAMILAIEIKTT